LPEALLAVVAQPGSASAAAVPQLATAAVFRKSRRCTFMVDSFARPLIW
jgi:hypothetical protein